MKTIFKVLFFVSAVIFCLSLILDNDLLRTITKPLPLISLLFIIKTNVKYNKLIFFGFIFSLLGDIFLLKVLDFFILGLSAFLTAHIFYIIAFRTREVKLKIFSSVPFYIIAVALGYYFYPNLGDMLLPVFAYIFVIITMVWRAFLQRKYNKYALFAFIGAVLFAVSDTNIAFTKFVTDYELSKLVTIILYWSAQYLIYISTKKVQ